MLRPGYLLRKLFKGQGPAVCLGARRGKNRGAVKDLGRSVIKFDGGDSPTVLVTSHTGFIKDFYIMLVDELGCSKCAGWEW